MFWKKWLNFTYILTTKQLCNDFNNTKKYSKKIKNLRQKLYINNKNKNIKILKN